MVQHGKHLKFRLNVIVMLPFTLFVVKLSREHRTFMLHIEITRGWIVFQLIRNQNIFPCIDNGIYQMENYRRKMSKNRLINGNRKATNDKSVNKRPRSQVVATLLPFPGNGIERIELARQLNIWRIPHHYKYRSISWPFAIIHYFPTVRFLFVCWLCAHALHRHRSKIPPPQTNCKVFAWPFDSNAFKLFPFCICLGIGF